MWCHYDYMVIFGQILQNIILGMLSFNPRLIGVIFVRADQKIHVDPFLFRKSEKFLKIVYRIFDLVLVYFLEAHFFPVDVQLF